MSVGTLNSRGQGSLLGESESGGGVDPALLGVGAGGDEVSLFGVGVAHQAGLDVGEFVEDGLLAGGRGFGVLALVAPAEDAEESEGDEADGDVSADAAFGPVEDRADGEGVLEDAEAVFDAPEFGVAGTDVGAGAMAESG